MADDETPRKSREELDALREAEPLDPAEVPMDLTKMEGQTFVGMVNEVKTTSEFQLNKEGEPQKEKGKFPYVNCLLTTDFLEDGQYYRWKWKSSNSKQGMHAKVLDKLSKVRILKADGTDTGKRGVNLTNVEQLLNQTFKFEKMEIEFGKDSEGQPIIVHNFPMPVDYYLPEEEAAEGETPAAEEAEVVVEKVEKPAAKPAAKPTTTGLPKKKI